MLKKINEIIDFVPQSLNGQSTDTASLKDVIGQFIADEAGHFNTITSQIRKNLWKLRDALLGKKMIPDFYIFIYLSL